MRALTGFLCVVVIVGYGVYLTKRDRRSGKVSSKGRPVLDNVLLLTSGMVVAVVLVIALEWLNPNATRPGSLGRLAFDLVMIAFAAGVTYMANLLLTVKKRKKHLS